MVVSNVGMETIDKRSSWGTARGSAPAVPGRLTINGGGIRLVTETPLAVADMDVAGLIGAVVELPIVHGETDAGCISLLDAETVASPFGSSVTRAQAAVIGDAWVKSDAFVEARFSFDWLTAWLAPKSTYDRGEHDDDPILTADLAEQAPCDADAGRATVESVAATSWKAERNAVSVRRETYVRVFLPSALGWDAILRRYIRPLQDLLVVALGRPAQLTGTYLRPAGQPDAPAAALLELRTPLVHRADRGRPTYQQLHAYSNAVLLDDSEFVSNATTILSGWFVVIDKHRVAVMRLNGPSCAPFNYLDNQWAAVSEPMESLHMGLFAAREKTPAEHKARVAAVVAAMEAAGLDQAIQTWATKILESPNDKGACRVIGSR